MASPTRRKNTPMEPVLCDVMERRMNQANARRRSRNKLNYILCLIASTAIIVSYAYLTWRQTAALKLLQLQHYQFLADPIASFYKENFVPPPAANPPADPPKPTIEPIKFIAVVGMYHSGTSTMYQSIKLNEKIAAEKGIHLYTYDTGSLGFGGYPPCGISLLPDSTVDVSATMGNATAGILGHTARLFGQYGTVWGDWHGKTQTSQELLKHNPPHRNQFYYTWWKHTPPQHPVLTCFRPDTLHVIMVRHPKKWRESMKKKLYDIKYYHKDQLWVLNRRSPPGRMPSLEIRFRSLYNAWEYYMSGYLSWEAISTGKNCYAHSDGWRDSDIGKENCLGGINKIPDGKRNIVIVRYEDYVMNPKRILAEIYSFATRGLINATTDQDKFVPDGEQKIKESKKGLEKLKESNFFSVKSSHWEGATELIKMCVLLGYSCDESKEIFISDIKKG
mmetsp:Transcript_37623/g.79329  ORF Transcript_37623/g.79329 Transcript_37623/m.79329 type:complete len:448 (-) Transcript_37623:151-1494(-)